MLVVTGPLAMFHQCKQGCVKLIRYRGTWRRVAHALPLLTQDCKNLEVRGPVDLKFTLDIVPLAVIHCTTNVFWDAVVCVGASREGATGTGLETNG